MEIKELLKELRENEVSLSLDGENLRLKFDHQELPGELVGKIKAAKNAIISYLKENSTTADVKAAIMPVPLSDEGHVLSSSQQRLWVLSQFEDGLAAYNITHQVELNGQYDITLFKRAVFAVLERHEILRTAFKKNSEGETRQWVVPMQQLDFAIHYQDLSGEADPLQAANDYVKADTDQPFDLEKAPLLRAALLQVAPGRYVFHYNIHHIIGDGWSMGVLANDVMAYYQAFLSGIRAALAPLTIQYKDFAAWQLKELTSAENTKHKEFWLTVLSGELPVTDLPSNLVRPAVRTQQGHTLETYLSRTLTSQLKAFTKAQEGSLFITLLALWEVLIYRYTGQEELITGSPVAGRNHADLENQIGCFVNTVVFRDQVAPNDSFLAHFNRVKKNALQAYAHQTYPFDQLLDDLNPKRYVNRNAIFDMMVVLQNTGKKREDSGADINTNAVYDKGAHLAKLDLEVNFAEAGSYLSFNVNFNTDVYEREMVTSLMEHFKQLASAIMADPEAGIQTFELLAANEKVRILEEFNLTDTVFEPCSTVVALFAAQAARNPDNTAVVFEGTTLTYKQLDDLSTQFSRYLADRYKITRNDLAGIKQYRSEWMIITILGILKAGGAYLPIDPAYPQERLEYIRTDSAYKVCIDETVLENFKALQENYEATPIDAAILPADYAYAIYTSGSTGQPKGVLNHHAGLTNRLLWMKTYLNVSPEAVILQKTPYTFDVSVWELLLPLICGAKLVFAIPDGHKDPYYLQNLVKEQQVTIAHFVPSMLKVFLNNVDSAAITSLQQVICSGEVLPAKVVSEFKTKINSRIYNLYGPTEAAIDVTAIDLTHYDTELNGVPIGYPVSNTGIYLVNDAMMLQPVGVPGELLIGGVQVAHGYLNKPELTAAKFIENPFRKDDRLYRTGDIAKWNSDGSLTFLGRRDNQVKIRGHRIELGEVTTQLLQHPEIKEAVVCARKNAEQDQELVAYIVSPVTQNASDLRRFLAARVPEYELPAYFIQLATLPLSANGKIDEKALPAPETQTLTAGTAYVAPRNETEEKLIGIFARELGRQPQEIGINDNFFDLGANSIKLIKILNEIKAEMNVDIKPVFLFQYANINDLVKNVFTETAKEHEQENVLLSEEIDDMIDLMEE